MLAACGDGSTLPDGTLAPVRVGLVVSLQGNLATLGEGWKNAALLVEQEVNAAGGPLPGRRLEMVIADDQTNSEVGGRVGRELLDDGVIAIIGAGASSVTKAVAESTFMRMVPQISCCSTSPELTTFQPPRERFFFRTVGSDLVQASVLARAARDRFFCTKLAIFVQNDAYGTPFGAAIEQRFMQFGGTSVTKIPFMVERPSYATEVAMGIASMADCIAIVGFAEDAGTIRREWQSAGGPSVQFIGTDGVRDPNLPTVIGDSMLADGFVGTAPFSGASSGQGATPRYIAFAANFDAVFGQDPKDLTFGSSQYDAAALLVLAIARAGVTDGVAIRDALYDVASPNGGERVFGPGELDQALVEIRNGSDIDYEGASGPVNIDDLGNVTSDYELWRYSAADGRILTTTVIRSSEIDP